jgi:hypothetical protein
LTWPRNLGHATAPHEAQLARFAQSARELITLSALGEVPESDLVVTEGHKHDTEETILLWRQLGQWTLSTQSAVGVQTVGRVVSGVTPRSMGTYPFRVPLSVGGTVAPYRWLYPRVRVTTPTPGGPTTGTLQLTGDLVRLPGGAPVVVATLPPLRISWQAGPPVVSYSDRFFGWGPIEVSEADLVAASGRPALRLTGSTDLAGQQGTVLELSVGLLGGL